MPKQPVLHPRRPIGHRAIIYGALATAATLWMASTPASASVHSDFVAEQNLATRGPSMQYFAEGGDAVQRMSGTLSYSIPIGQSYPVGGEFSYRLALVYSSSIWNYDTGGSEVAANPSGRFNAGLGWRLSFGDLLAPNTAQNPSNYWVFCNGKGELTRFYGTLYDGETYQPNVFYSRDASFRRLSINGNVAVIENRNGQKKTFRFDATSNRWDFESSSDVFGNQMTLNDLGTSWEISDNHGRLHKVFFAADPTGTFAQRIDRIEVAGFGGTVSTYQFTYAVDDVARPVQDTSTSTPALLSTSLLTGISGPLGAVHTMGYETGNQTSQALLAGGRLQQITLPTGGSIAYQYETFALPYLAGAVHTADPVGVASRTLLGFSGQTVAQWSFQRALDIPRVAGHIDQPRELTTTVHFPDGHFRKHKFSIYVSGDATNSETPPMSFGFKRYGQPYTEIGRVSGNPYRLSEEVYDAGGTKLQSRYVRYIFSGCSGCFDLNPRVDREKRTSHGATDYSVFAERYTFNGLGRFGWVREKETGTETPLRDIHVDYSSNRPLPSEPWILDQYTTKTVTQGGETRTSEVCIDPATGRTTRTRTYAADSQRSANDLIRVYEVDANGNAAGTKYYGGDVQAVATSGALCGLALPTAEQYASFYNHQYGVVQQSGWLKADGSVFVENFSSTVDPHTGLLISASQGDDFVWTYDYDLLGRRISETPMVGHGGKNQIVYTAADLTNGLGQQEDHITREANNGILQRRIVYRDAFGREIKSSFKHGGGWAAVNQSYNAMGQLATKTSAGGVTQWLAYDPWGRVTHSRPPEGASHDRFYTYFGNRSRTESVSIGKEWNQVTNTVTEITRTTTTTLNRYGHVIEERINDADGDVRTTTYVRNLAGRATQTTLTDGVRTSQWNASDVVDRRGFRVVDGYGQAVTGYDALGNLTLQDVGPHNIFHRFDRAGRLFEQRKDSVSGQLITRNTYATANVGSNYRKGKLYQTFRINRNVPHMPNGYVRVTDTLSYEANAGALSKRRTSVVAGFGDSMKLADFETTQTVNGLGKPLQSTYPTCLAESTATVLCTPFDERTLQYTYVGGDLTRLTASFDGQQEIWLDQVTYNNQGIITQRNFGNGWLETRTPDPVGGRLLQMQINHPTYPDFYDSGTAVYDGKGRLVQLGQQRKISTYAYSLRVESLNGVANPGAPANYFSSDIDVFGLPIWRTYTVPARPGVNDPDGEEDVLEVFVYGPGNRLIWSRNVNDYDLWVHGKSYDTWNLVDTVGRHVRTQEGQTLYVTKLVPLFNAVTKQIQFRTYNRGGEDIVSLGGKTLGTADHSVAPLRKFYHYDLRGGLHAISDDRGGVEDNTMDLF